MRIRLIHSYSTKVQWSDEDACFVAVCPEFPDLSGFGDTREQAVVELEIALAAAIDVYQAEEWSLPELHGLGSFSGKVLVRMPKRLHATLAQQAEREGVSLNTLMVTLLAEATVALPRFPTPTPEKYDPNPFLSSVDSSPTRAVSKSIGPRQEDPPAP